MSLNDYEILKQIGTGAFSTVYLVKNKKDSLIYALKRVELNKMLPNEKDNSLNEIRLLSQVNHINIISYKESFYEEQTNTLNLVLEYADAGDLQSKISALKNLQKYFSEKTIWSLFIQMIQGIKALHDKNIIHRDLKSANIFLMKNGICKLGDLNVSKEAKTGLLKTQTGTPYFASPEVWSGKPYGLKSDIWSLGCILYQITTLRMPFKGNNFKEVYKNVLKCKYDPPPKTYSQDLSLIIKKMLQIDPDKRPSAQEILDDPIIKEKIKLLDNDNNNINNNDIINSNKTDNNNNKNKLILQNINEEFNINDIKNNDNIFKTEIKLYNLGKKNNLSSRLLKTVKYKDKNMKDLFIKNKKEYNISNNYRIFKNYDTNPDENKEKKEIEKDNKLYHDKLKSKKYYNRTTINKYKKYKKYKTININLLKAKSNLNEKIEQKENINKNNTLNDNNILDNNYRLDTQSTTSYINPVSEGNSINSNYKNIKKQTNENQTKKYILNSKTNHEKQKTKHYNIRGNCISAKTRRKPLSCNKQNKYYNNDETNNEKIIVQNPNNYQYKKILLLNTNITSDDSSINPNYKRIACMEGYGYEFSQTDIDNKETNNTTGKSIIYGKNLDNKLHFNLSSKQKEEKLGYIKKIKSNNSKDLIEEKNENLYNKKYNKNAQKTKIKEKNISTIGLDSHPVKPNIKISNLIKEFSGTNSKPYSPKLNKYDKGYRFTLNKKDVKRNKSTFEFKNEEKNKIMTLHPISTKKNYSQNGLDIDMSILAKNKKKNKNKYTINGGKLSLQNNKFHTHKKLFRKSLNNIKILESINNEIKNYKCNNVTSNKANINRSKTIKNNYSKPKKDINNIRKSISLSTMENPVIFNNTQSNETNNINKKNLNSSHKKFFSFKFDDFKTKRLKKNNYKINNRNKMTIKFHHIPFIKTPDKEQEKLEHSFEHNNNNKNMDPTIKMLINPIKIVEKKGSKRKLFPVHTHIKLNKLNLLNNAINKNPNIETETSIHNELNEV